MVRWTKERVIEEIRSITVDGYAIYRLSMHKASLYDAATKQFGGWKQACKAAGVKAPGSMHVKKSKAEMRETIKRGRQVLADWGISLEAARG